MSSYGPATSRIGVLTIGCSAAMYSSVLVGLMKRVASLSANGMMLTSQPARWLGQLLVGREPSQCRFGRCGTLAGSILTTGPIMKTCHSGWASASASTDPEVHALVDDAEENEPRSRDRRLLGRDRPARAALREVFDVDAAREAMDVRMELPLGAEQARSAGEDGVGRPQQRLLHLAALGRREAEVRELVHAVVDHDFGRERRRHRDASGV
jgi:hypothetical protein